MLPGAGAHTLTDPPVVQPFEPTHPKTTTVVKRDPWSNPTGGGPVLVVGWMDWVRFGWMDLDC